MVRKFQGRGKAVIAKPVRTLAVAIRIQIDKIQYSEADQGRKSGFPRSLRSLGMTGERLPDLFLVLQKLLSEQVKDLVQFLIGIGGGQQLLAVFHYGL